MTKHGSKKQVAKDYTNMAGKGSAPRPIDREKWEKSPFWENLAKQKKVKEYKPFIYKGITLNPNKRYFGPEDHWFSTILPPTPIGLESILFTDWNKAAFMHDVDYSLDSGEKKKGIFGWIQNYLNREKADTNFYNSLIDATFENYKNSKITIEKFESAQRYAELAFKAVRTGGAFFYKKSYMEKE